MEQQSKGIPTWVLLGGGAVAVVIVIILARGSSSSNASNTGTTGSNTSIGTFSGITSNTGTPLNNNNSLLGFVDPSTGIQWVLDTSNQWVSILPAGSLPPNYTPGSAVPNPFFVPTTNTPTGTSVI